MSASSVHRYCEGRKVRIPSPNFWLTTAAAPLRIPKARMTGGGMRSWGWLILKFSRERSVCAPQYLSEGTWISPKASLSVRIEVAILREEVKVLLRGDRRYNGFCGAVALAFTRQFAEHGFRGWKVDDERDKVPIDLRGSERFRHDGPRRIMVAINSILGYGAVR